MRFLFCVTPLEGYLNVTSTGSLKSFFGRVSSSHLECEESNLQLNASSCLTGSQDQSRLHSAGCRSHLSKKKLLNTLYNEHQPILINFMIRILKGEKGISLSCSISDQSAKWLDGNTPAPLLCIPLSPSDLRFLTFFLPLHHLFLTHPQTSTLQAHQLRILTIVPLQD